MHDSEKTLELETIIEGGGRPGAEVLIDACHILAREGHNGGLAGQVTVRDGDGFLTHCLGVGLEEIGEGDVLRVGADGRLTSGRGQPNPGVRFHAWIYERHERIGAIVHTHSPAAAAYSLLGSPFVVAHMDTCMFYDDCGYLGEWPGVPTGDEEGRLIAKALDGRRSALLVNHGFVCTGASLEEATYLAVFAERGARMLLDAMAVGALNPIEPAMGREAHDFLLQPAIVQATFAYWARQAARQTQV
ncbi:MAG: aldolase [Burkholderiaceae bacterium]